MQAKRASTSSLTPEQRIAQHKQQVFIQVWLPLLLGVLLALGLGGLAIAGAVIRSTEVNRWGSISAIFLLIPVLLGDLIVAAIVIASTYGIRKLSEKIPGWLYAVQALFSRIAAAVRNLADRLVTPVIRINSAGAGAKSLREKLTR
jgi:hypothetical protein